MQGKVQKTSFVSEMLVSKLSLLRREYLLTAVNVLINSLKILQRTKRDFFQLNYLHSDQ